MLHLRPYGGVGHVLAVFNEMELLSTPPDRQGIPVRPSTRDWSVEASLPEYEMLGYSWEEADRLVRTGEALWDRYTALGLTIDANSPPPAALRPFEVLLQAVWQAGIAELFKDSGVRS